MSGTQHRILVVDDEEAVRGAFRDALTAAVGSTTSLEALESELFGKSAKTETGTPQFDLTLKSQGEDAVEAVRHSLADGNPFGLVFLDMRIPPGIDGAETARRIRELDPLINIVLVTGYADIDVADVAALVKPADKLFFIAKPFQVAEIRQQAAALSARWVADSESVRALQQRNRELQIAVREALAARENALQASVSKSAFLSNVSHELRTPLNAIIGFSELMCGEIYGPLGDERYADYSKEINAAGSSLLSSLNDIIDTARLDTGNVQLCYESIKISQCIALVVNSLAPLAQSRRVTLHVTPGDDQLCVHGDPKRVKQIVFSILHNGVKFAPDGTQVDIEVKYVDECVRVSVTDRGCGISAMLIEATNQPFASDRDIFTRGHGGLGLGLWIAKRLMELHKGQLEIRSRAGSGTTVVLSFPASDQATRVA